MRKIFPQLFGVAIFGFSASSMAQTAFTIKSFTVPVTTGGYYTFNGSYYVNAGSVPFAIQVKTTVPFSCGGTNTSDARIAVETTGDAGFLMIAELINAAKFGYQIESSNMLFLNPALNSSFSGMGCQVRTPFVRTQ